MIYTLDQQFDIFRYYFGSFEIKKPLKNPLRRDTTPKCYFNIKNDKLIFIDWAFIPTHLDCIEYVKRTYNLGDRLQSINKINRDLKYTDKTKGNFNINVIEESKKAPLVTLNIVNIEETKPEYTVLNKDFENYELDYWNQFNINLPILNKYEVKPVKWVLKDNVINYAASKYNPIFGYYENDHLFKIYNPLGSKVFKWRTIKALLEGYSKLEYKTNVCFITSSLKDTMCLNSLGFDSFNLPSENSYKILLPKIEDLFNKFEFIMVYLNNDKAGVEYSKLLTLEIDQRLKYINNPSFLKETDPSDVVKNLGKNYLLEIINEKLNRDNIKLIKNG